MATDPYHWAKENDMYISQDELANLIRTKDPSLLVVDVRNNDNGGGRIAKSLHIPDGETTFSPSKVVDIALHGGDGCVDDALTRKRKDILVFHCMESARRGPRCAKRLVDYIAETKARCNNGHKNSNNRDDNSDGEFRNQFYDNQEFKDWKPRICVLWGGADLWIRRFWKDKELVEDFDPEYWSFGGSDDNNTSGCNNDDVLIGSHSDYLRPDDQPQTEWSSAGSAVKK